MNTKKYALTGLWECRAPAVNRGLEEEPSLAID